jgi:hypothetical protein
VRESDKLDTNTDSDPNLILCALPVFVVRLILENISQLNISMGGVGVFLMVREESRAGLPASLYIIPAGHGPLKGEAASHACHFQYPSENLFEMGKKITAIAAIIQT